MQDVTFDEDSFCQIEILPIENLNYCRSEINKIIDFSTKHKSGIGWDDIYVRKENPRSTINLKMDLDIFRNNITIHLPEIKTVFYRDFNAKKIKATKTAAFGKTEGEVLFIETDENNIIKTIWCENPMPEVIKLPNSEELLIVDWGWNFVSPLIESKTILDYIEEREKRINENRINLLKEFKKTKDKKWWEFWKA